MIEKYVIDTHTLQNYPHFEKKKYNNKYTDSKPQQQHKRTNVFECQQDVKRNIIEKQ